MVALLAALLIQTPPALKLDIPACRVEALAETIGKAANTHLEVAPNMQGEILAIRVKGVKLDDLLARIGKTMWAKWVPIDGGFRLEQPQELRVQEARLDRKLRLQAIQEALYGQKKAFAKSSQFSDADLETAKKQYRALQDQMVQTAQGAYDSAQTEKAAKEAEAIQARTPSARLLTALTASLDPDALADMAIGERIVYSTGPTSMQRPLTGRAAAIVQGFVAEQNRFAAAMATVPKPTLPTDNQGEGGSMQIVWQNGMENYFGNVKPIKDVGKVLVAVKSNGPTDFQIDVMVVGRDGNIAFEANNSFGPNTESNIEQEPDDTAASKAAPEKEDTSLIPLGPDTAENLDLIRLVSTQQRVAIGEVQTTDFVQSEGMGQPERLPPKLADRLRDPYAREPLALCWSDLVLGSEPGKNVVARLPDSTFDLTEAPVESNKPTVQMAKDWMESEGSLDRDEADGWVTFTPAYSLQARHDRCDRARLRNYIAGVEHGDLGIDGYADIANGLPEPNGNTYMSMADLFGEQPRSMFGTGDSSTDWNWWQLYAQLSPPMRQALKAGTPLKASALPTNAQNLLHRIVYWEPATLGASGTMAMMQGFVVTMPQDLTEQADNGPDIAREPTESLPFGIPTDAFLKGTLQNELVASIADGSPSGMTGAMGPEQLAIMEAGVFDALHTGQTLDTTKLRKGTQESLFITLEFRPKVATQANLSHTRVSKAIVSLDTFPEDFRTRYERMKKNAAQWHITTGPQQQSPPPPPN